MSRKPAPRSLRLKLWEQDHVADVFLTQQHHAETIDAQAHAAGWRHSMFECRKKIFVQLLLLAARLVLQALTLRDWIVLLAIGGGDLLAVDAALEDFDCCR